MLNTYVVEGGVGKCTAFTALVPKLKKISDVQIHTPYIHAFAGNPNVKMAYEATIPLADPRIQASDNIYYSEPYKSNFQFGKEHIIESYCREHNVEYNPKMVPKLYTEGHGKSVKEWLDKNKIDKYLLIQLSGGQSTWNVQPGNPYNNINPNRNYQPFLGQQVVHMLREEYPDVTIIDCTLANEPAYMDTIKASDLHWVQVHELLKNAEGFVSIDSCLNHFSPSAEKQGVVVWGSTRWTQFGYSHNTNLHYHMKKDWDEAKYNDGDPRNNMVEPKLILDSYKNLGKLKPVACATK